MSNRFILPAALLSLGLVAGCSNPNPGNPPGTAAERAVDKAAGTDISGAYPGQADGTRNNPPGTATERAYDRATDSNTSGAYPRNTR